MDYQTVIKAPISAELADFIEMFNRSLDHEDGMLAQALNHIRQRGGKRMRPILILLIAKSFGAVTEVTQHAAIGLELLHTASLVHDDVVDEGMMRRGRETANARWGNGPAVLVGDFLYTRSFQMMVRAGNLRVMQALADAANRLSEGEVLQMANAHDPDVDEKRYFAVIERKTACLFEAAAHMAAALADAPKAYEDACAQYALCLGNAFQIADDILDYKGVAADIGKNLGADLREGKVTLPVIYALQATSDADKEMIRAAIRAGDGDFEAISRIVVETGAIEKCHARALEEAKKGVEALNSLPAGQFRESLIKFLSFAAERDR